MEHPKMWFFTIFSILFLTSFVTAAVTPNESYDYIVVGSGPGGGTLASQLAKGGESVLLLEAGDDQGENLHEKVPGFFPLASNDPLFRWDFFVKYHSDDAITRKFEHLVYKTTSGEFYVGTNPPAGATMLGVYYPRTGTLGGCSTHNAMCAPLASNRDWDDIATLTGDKSWSAKAMRQHYINLENNHLVAKGTPGHGFEGFLDITVNSDEYLKNQSNAQIVLKAAAKQIGQDPAKLFELLQRDLNNNDKDRDYQTGLFGFPAHRSPKGLRVSARDAVVGVLNSKTASGAQKYKLTLGIHSFVTKILFDTKGKKPRATGVEYLAGQSVYGADPRYKSSNAAAATTKRAFARKEVIIAGGAFNTPQILMLSGIGPKDHLKSFDIPLLVNLPGVGSRLQDNTEYGVAATASQNFTSVGPIATYGAPGDPALSAWYEGRGPYTQGPLDAIMFKSSASVNGERDIYFFGLAGNSFRGFWPGQTVNQVPADGPDIFDFSMVKFNPQNDLGTVRLTSKNPLDTPDINFRFFEAGADIDLQALAEGVEFGRKVFDSIAAPLGPFKEVLPCIGDRTCDVKENIKTQAWSHHATSSAAIGADKDPLAVLDSKFRVRGVEGLRVVDASAFPKTPGAFPVIPTFMLGMKAAEDILKDKSKW